MVTRVRVDVEASTPEDCIEQLNEAFRVLNAGNNYTFHVTTGGTWESSPMGPYQVFPAVAEFREQLIEAYVTDMGAIRHKARKTMAYVPSEEGNPELPPPDGPSSVTRKVMLLAGKKTENFSQIAMDVHANPDANAWGAIWGAAGSYGYEPEEWWDLTADGEDVHPLATFGSLGSSVVFDGTDPES